MWHGIRTDNHFHFDTCARMPFRCALQIFIAFYIINHTRGFKCFSCATPISRDLSPFSVTPQLFTSQCEFNPAITNVIPSIECFTACLKLSYPVYTNGETKSVTIRDCMDRLSHAIPDPSRFDTCEATFIGLMKADLCLCRGENCNGSSHISISIIWSTIPLSILLYFRV